MATARQAAGLLLLVVLGVLGSILVAGTAPASSRLHARDFVLQIVPGAVSTDSDLPKLAGVVRGVADEFGLRESDDSLSWYRSADPVVVEIIRVRDRQVVTVWQLSDGRKATGRYRSLRDRLEQVLKHEFPDRIEVRKSSGPLGKPWRD